MAHVLAHPFLLTFVAFALSCLLLRGGRSIFRGIVEHPFALWVATLAVAAVFALYSGAWRTIDWHELGYFFWVGLLAFCGLALLQQIYTALKNWTDRHR